MEALSVIWAPVRTLARVAEERRALVGFGVMALGAALAVVAAGVDALGGVTASQFSPRNLPDLPPEFYASAPGLVSVGLLVNAVLSPFIWWLVVALLMQLVTRFFGGTGPFSAMLAVVGVAYVPVVIAGVLNIPVVGLQAALGPGGDAASILGTVFGLLSLAFSVWHVVLVVIGASFARRVGYGESAGSCAISCAGCVGLILIVAVAVGVLLAVILGAAGSTGPS